MSVKKAKHLYRYTFDIKTLKVSYTVLNVVRETSSKYYLENGQHIEACDVYDYYHDNRRYCSSRLDDLFRENRCGYLYAVKPATASVRKEIIKAYIQDLEYRIRGAKANYENCLKRSEEAYKEANEATEELNRVQEMIK